MILICENIRVYDNYDPYSGEDVATDAPSPVALVSTEEEAKKFISIMVNCGLSSIHDYAIIDIEPNSYHAVMYKGKVYRVFNSRVAAVNWVSGKKRDYEVLPLREVKINVDEIEFYKDAFSTTPFLTRSVRWGVVI